MTTFINLETDSFIKDESRYIAIISDADVASLYGEKLLAKIAQTNNFVRLFSFPAGEKNKNRDTVHQLQDQLLDWGIDSDGLIIAVGGGVVTDVAGFVAATLFRGVDWISIPTTLLGMVDASIGGKTGINTIQGKNLIGAFWNPKNILVDLQTLQSLPEKNLLEGVSEMLKHGVIADITYFNELLRDKEAILNLNSEVLQRVIDKSYRIKTEIIAQDLDKKKGMRHLLNFGHTVAHALERETNYDLSHGESVAIGICGEAMISNRLGLLPKSDLEKVIEGVKQFGLPTSFLNLKKISVEKLYQSMQYDKKSQQKNPRFVLVKSLGRCDPCREKYCSPVPEVLVKEVLHDLCVD